VCWADAVIGRLATAAALFALAVSPAFAQGPPPDPKWELEVHVGQTVVVNPIDGNPQTQPAAPFFSTGPGRVSRPVSSWYWGDGATLIGEVAGLLRIPNSQQIVPLDNFMRAPTLQLKSGPSFGARIGYAKSPHIRFEASVDWKGGNIEVIEGIADAIERTRASFIAVWQALLATSTTFQNSTVASVSTFDPGTAGQFLAIGSIDLRLYPDKDAVPYVSIGGGVLTTLGRVPTITMTGRYTTQIAGAAPIDETDAVVARYDLDKHLVVTMVGVGWKHMLSDRWGVRADLREHLSGNRVRQTLSASPSVVTAAAANAGVAVIGTFETIQLSNQNTATVPTTLSGRNINTFTMFKGTGMESRFSMSAGIFLRF